MGPEARPGGQAAQGHQGAGGAGGPGPHSSRRLISGDARSHPIGRMAYCKQEDLPTGKGGAPGRSPQRGTLEARELWLSSARA